MFFLWLLIKIILIFISIAYFTIQERKLMASVQRRKGPNVVGFFGLAQPLADGFKLLLKEIVIPVKASKTLFSAAPLLIIILSLSTWIFIPGNVIFVSAITKWFTLDNCVLLDIFIDKPFWVPTSWNSCVSFTEYSLLFILAFSSLNVYGIITAGWSSYSKYAFLGSLRSSAQMISYEISIGLILLPIISITNSFNFAEIILSQIFFGWNVIIFFPLSILFLISMLAETNRTPFDLPEAEAELVAGYNVEYSSIVFAMFFLGEYSNMLLISVLLIILFFGGWSFFFTEPGILLQSAIFSIKITLVCLYFVLVRALLPRYKYNQLLYLGWKLFLPFSVAGLCLISFFQLSL